MIQLRMSTLLIGALLSMSCASGRLPASFLRTEDRGLIQQLGTVVNVDLREVPIKQLSQQPPFDRLPIWVGGKDGARMVQLVSLHAQRVTIRRALWMIAEKYGVRIEIERVNGADRFVRITVH